MDIIIKSFNRPFYLDKCIASIYKCVNGNFNIQVLDDGTPEKYLNKIKQKYPNIKILKSENYNNKKNAIDENFNTGKEINGFQIPTNLWINTVKNASPYFIITEDDVWFTNSIHVDELEKTMINENINLLKLGRLGKNERAEYCKYIPINSEIISIIPNLFLAPYSVLKTIFTNKYKSFSILYRLRLFDNSSIFKYWCLNSILMGMYKKEYWLEIWKNSNGKVNEIEQLINAAVYYKKHKKNPNFICELNNEVMKTTFISSATNSYHKYGYNFDVNIMNYILNEEWLNNNFDSMQNYPNDFSEDYISSFLLKANHPKASNEEWCKWKEKFKNQYKNQGCKID